MKKAVFHSIMVLAVVLGLTLAMASPVPLVAQNGPTTSVVMFLTADLPTTTNSQGAHTYTVTVMNQAIPGASDADVTVTFYPPGPTGALGEYGSPVPLDTARTIAVGDTVVYNWNGDGGAEAKPELRVIIPDIPLNEGVSTVNAAATVYAFYDPHDDSDEKTIPAQVIWPDTKVTIGASETTVSSGDSVTLTITEENTGEVDLTDPYVEVWKSGALLTTLASSPDSGDIADPGVLNVGETWSWTINSGPITSTTTFVALGFGTDSADLEVSYAKGFEDERATETVFTDMPPVGGTAYPISNLALLAPWIVLAGLIAGAAVFVWSRRAQGRA